MPLDLPIHVYILFYFATILTCFLLFKATNFNKGVIGVVTLFLIVQGTLGFTDFYLDLDARPPRSIFLVPPAILTIILAFSLAKSRNLMDQMNQKWLTLVHIIRIPIEVCLYWIFVGGFIPEIMTFSGQNFDILAGITAPIMVYLFFIKKSIGPKLMLVWNIASLLLLLNIVITALLAAPLPFQQICFEDPNVGILYYPFLWLAGVIVPIVMFAHLVSIRSLITTLKTPKSNG